MDSGYLAHIDGDRIQTVEEHLEGVARICGGFARAFGAEEQGRWIGLAHDIGKCSAAFQRRLHGGKKVDHATAGAVECLKTDPARAAWAAFCITGHHGGMPDGGSDTDPRGTGTLWGRLKKGIPQAGMSPPVLVPAWENPVPLTPPPPPPPGYGKDNLTDSFLIRMLWSCLVDADFLDTEAFMSGGTVHRDSGRPLPDLLEDLETKKVGPWLEAAGRPDPEMDPRQQEIRDLRCEILRTCREAGARPRGLYTLTVPTGGGKTVASMAFALHHAVAHGMDRIIYVIPYTSIIEQNAAVFRDIFGSADVLEHHSNASADSGRSRDSDVDDTADCATDDAASRAALAAENWDAPIVVTTAVQFFDSLYGDRTSQGRKLHNIANSVIIFDEAQTLPTSHLLPCVAAIASLVKEFRATAVLCTATQPALDGLFRGYDVSPDELCPGTARLYEQFRRVTFQNAGTLDADALADHLRELPQVLCIVDTRRTAQEVYRKLPKEGSFHLSTLMYPVHRRAVLDEIRERLASGLPCRVVSTSLIEAGVDVDFPAVWREMAGLDQILQAAGRCNREGKRDPAESIVTVFEGVSRTPEMLKINIGAAREALRMGADPGDPKTVDDYFEKYLGLKGEDALDVTPIPGGGTMQVVQAFQGGTFPFRTVGERFHMIDSATRTVYVPREGGANLLDRLRYQGPSRELYRELGQYAVSVYERQYRDLLDAGAIEPLDGGDAVLRDLTRYKADTGLSVEDGDLSLLCI